MSARPASPPFDGVTDMALMEREAHDDHLVVEVQRIFERDLGLEVPSADTDLFDSGTLDSLVLVRLLTALEEQLGTRIALDRLEMSDFRTIARIAGFLSRNGAGTNGTGP